MSAWLLPVDAVRVKPVQQLHANRQAQRRRDARVMAGDIHIHGEGVLFFVGLNAHLLKSMCKKPAGAYLMVYVTSCDILISNVAAVVDRATGPPPKTLTPTI